MTLPAGCYFDTMGLGFTEPPRVHQHLRMDGDHAMLDLATRQHEPAELT